MICTARIPCNANNNDISESSRLREDLELDDLCLIHEVLPPPGSLNSRHLESNCQNDT